MDVFFQLLVNTLITGSVYGIMAMSFALSYRTTRFFNLAHGSMAPIGGYAFLVLNQEYGLPSIACFPPAIVIAGLAGLVTDRLVYAPQRRRKASGSVLLVVSLGVVTVIESLLSMTFGTQFRSLTPIADIHSYPLLGASITQAQILLIVANIVIFAALLVLIYKTKFGRMLRAISSDLEVARVLGIRTDRYIGAVFFITALLAGAGGVLVGLDTGLQPTLGFYLLLKGIVAAIIGSVTGVSGALVGAFVLAAAENAGVWIFASEWRDAIAFIILLGFLLFRPEGLLGKVKE